jgi:putative ABC transport system permease protein
MYALRYILKGRGNNATRIISLTLGLLAGLLVFSYVNYEFSFDKFYPDADRIYKIYYSSSAKGFEGMSSQTNAPLAPALAKDFPQVSSGTRFLGPSDDYIKYGENVYTFNVLLADTSFFDVFGFNIIKGDPHSVLAAPDNIMISRSALSKMFGDGDPMGKVVKDGQGKAFTVAGIFEDIPSNCHIGKFDIIVPFEKNTGNIYTGWFGGDSFPAYIKIARGSSIKDVEKQLPEIEKKYGIDRELNEFKMKIVFVPVGKVNITASRKSLMSVLLAMGLLTLLVACFNYVLISISSMMKRSKTIAMLRCSGARKSDIFSIFLYETFILLLISMALAFMFIFMQQDQVRYISKFTASELFSLKSIWIPVAVISLAFLAGGLIPARLFSGVSLQAAFRGMREHNNKWKKALLFVQIICTTITFLMLIVSVLQFRSMKYGDIGFDHHNIVMARVVVNPWNSRTLMEEIKKIPNVAGAGWCENSPLQGWSGQPCYDENTHKMLFSSRYELIDDNYVDVLGLKMLAGKNIRFDGDVLHVLVNKKYADMRGWTPQQAAGHIITDSSYPGERVYTIAGVVSNIRVVDGIYLPAVFHNFKEFYMNSEGKSLRGIKKGMEMLCLIRLRRMDSGTISSIRELLKNYKSYDGYHIGVLDDTVTDNLQDISRYRNLFYLVCIIVVLLTLMGLLGYINDEIRGRSREIAIRKVNGAGPADIISLLLRDITMITIPAVVAGLAAGYFLIAKFLENFTNKINTGWWIFLISAAVVLILIYAAEYIATIGTVNSNPADTIRNN